MIFEWDDDKASSNLAKHGISFDQARSILEAATTIFDVGKTMDDGEQRYLAYGYLDETPIVVIFTMRSATLRIISARTGHRSERKRYGGNTGE